MWLIRSWSSGRWHDFLILLFHSDLRPTCSGIRQLCRDSVPIEVAYFLLKPWTLREILSGRMQRRPSSPGLVVRGGLGRYTPNLKHPQQGLERRAGQLAPPRI
jgi:hypothetical protein